MRALQRIATAALVVAVALGSLFLPAFYITLMNFIGLYSLVVLGLVMLTGYAGLASLGQAAFMGIGAYTAGILSSRFEVNPWLSILAGMVLCALFAYLIGLMTLRLKGHFLALATLAWGMIITSVFKNWIPVTGGNIGFGIGQGQRIPPLELFGLVLTEQRHYYWLIWLCVLVVLWMLHNLMRARIGLAIRALRTGAVAAASFGVNVFGLKLFTFVLAATLAALAGGLYTFLYRYLSPGPFEIGQSIDFLIMAVAGGLSSLWGAIFGSALIVGLEELLQQWLPSLVGREGNYEAVAFGLILILLLHRARKGIWPLIVSVMPTPTPLPVQQGLPALPARPKGQEETLLTVDEVSKRFGGLKAVDNLSFEVYRGEILGLIGPNGAGKSTMFNVITGVLDASGGKIIYRGERISGQSPNRIAQRGIARTFQHLHLINNLTLLDNVALGAYTRTKGNALEGLLGRRAEERAQTRAAALAQLTRVGLAASAFDLVSSLPLGKQRLVEIARALLADPELLLLDEPAAGLRKHEKTELAALLRKLRDEGITILLVEHDMELVMQLADRLVVMNYGTRLTQGTPEEVRHNPQVIEAYLGKGSTEGVNDA